MTNKITTPELSRIVQLADLGRHKTLNLDIQASKVECQALAQRMEISELKSLQAKLQIKVSQHISGNFRIDGHIKADLVQLCGVTSQPVNEVIDENFAETLTTSEENLTPEDEITGNNDIPVDLVTGDSFDAGEIVAQWLTLLLNPYPRSDAPEYSHNETARTEEGEPTHTPFDVLGSLKNQEK